MIHLFGSRKFIFDFVSGKFSIAEFISSLIRTSTIHHETLSARALEGTHSHGHCIVKLSDINFVLNQPLQFAGRWNQIEIH